MSDKRFLVGTSATATDGKVFEEVAIPFNDIDGIETSTGECGVAIKVVLCSGFREEKVIVVLDGGFSRYWNGLRAWIKEHTL